MWQCPTYNSVALYFYYGLQSRCMANEDMPGPLGAIAQVFSSLWLEANQLDTISFFLMMISAFHNVSGPRQKLER